MRLIRSHRFFATGGLFALLLVLALTLLATSSPTVANADTTCQTFSETGFKVCGRFLEYWNTHGGLVQQGFPVSDVFEEKNADPPAGDGKVHRVQYFQRARFEEHLENAAPYDVLLGLLGSEQFKTKYNGVTPLDAEVQHPIGTCRSFSETNQAVCGVFLDYWNTHGGLAQQGLPISDTFVEKNAEPPNGDGKEHVVQYFQRARFELHDENQSPYNVLLGLLGSEQLKAKAGGTSATPTPTQTVSVTSTPTPTATSVAATPTPTSKPVAASGCLPATTVEGVQACVSDPNPAKNSTVTVYGRLVVGGQAISGATMNTTWNYKSTTTTCGGVSGNDGIASCTKDIGGASKGYTVRIDVIFTSNGQSYSGSTSFTPQ
jgi:hypothetical protein